MPISKLDHALDAASRGLAVFPARGKQPSIKQWPRNATLKPSVITRWWTRWPDADIGIALDADIYVLDADGPAAMGALRGLDLPPTLTVGTARGEHRYLRVPHPLARMTGDGAGLRAIEGKGAPGPVTWAGSRHHTGHIYAIAHDLPIADMPAALVREIGPKRATRDCGDASPAELERWAATYQAARATDPVFTDVFFADAAEDLRRELLQLYADLPGLASGWADCGFRAGARLGVHVSRGFLRYEAALAELSTAFAAIDTQGADPGHVLRSIERGLAVGAREASAPA